jgi:RNA polymerase sigma factor (sigma-70 family)
MSAFLPRITIGGVVFGRCAPRPGVTCPTTAHGRTGTCQDSHQEPPLTSREGLRDVGGRAGLDMPAVRAYLRSRQQPGSDERLRVEAWDHLHAVGAAVLSAQARRHRLRHSEAEDVTQEVWVALLGNPPDCLDGTAAGRLHVWLERVLSNQWQDRLRYEGRRPSQSIRGIKGTAQEPVTRDEGPGAPAERRDEERRLWTAVIALCRGKGRRNGQVLVLRDLCEMTTTEVAETLGLTPAQVGKRRRRGRRQLRAVLEENRRPGRGDEP